VIMKPERILTAAAITVAAIALSARLGAQATAAAPAASAKALTSEVTGSAVKGKQLYYDHACYSCHGYSGETGARRFVPTWPATLASEASFIAFLRGRANAAPVQPSTSMPNYAAQSLSDASAKDIYAYIRTFKSNAPPADQIAVFKQILGSAQNNGSAATPK